jgi:hypothetical protein
MFNFTSTDPDLRSGLVDIIVEDVDDDPNVVMVEYQDGGEPYFAIALLSELTPA